MRPPLVSVVIAAYNAGCFLAETLDSALAQTYLRREIILVDDGSTDDTRARVEPYLPGIRYVRRSHEGLAAARNAGIALASGDYVALLDADDLWLPEKLAVQVDVAGRHPQSGLVACDGTSFDGARQLRAHLLGPVALEALERSATGEATGDFYHAMLAGDEWVGVPAQVLLPRAVVERMGLFADILNQDTEYWLRIAQRHPLTFHRHSLARYRVHPASLSGPLDGRADRYRRGHLAMLRIHAARCRSPERRLVARRMRRLAADAAYGTYQEGRTGDRRQASRALLGLLRARPWPPTILLYVAALWAPDGVRRIGARLLGSVRRGGNP
jgi:glycosyltransferase involved in cell wall biosynthesis